MCGFVSDGDILSTMSREAPAFADFYSFAADAAGEGFDKRLDALTHTTVGQLATRDVYSVQVDDDMRDVCAVLSSRHLKKVPVMRGDKVVGVINRSNITRHAVERYSSVAE